MTRGSRSLGIACGLLALTLAAPAFGGVAVIDQARSIATLTQNGTKTKTATPFAAFDQSVSDVFDAASGRHEEAFAQQTSSVSVSTQTLHIVVNGEASFNSLALGEPPEHTNVSADSSYSFTFTVDGPATFLLTETSEGSSPSIGAVFLGSRLERDGVTVPDWQFLGGGADPFHKSFSGTLTAGTYVYRGVGHGNGDVDHGDVTFTTDFTVTSTAVSAVPLPQSLWMALTAVPLAVAVVRRQKWCASR